MRLLKRIYYKFVFFISLAINKALRSYFNFVYHAVIGEISKKVDWKLFSEKFSIPGSLMYVMLNAPRWNTHAIIVTAGILDVKQKLTFVGLNSLNANCQSWTIVIYTQPDNNTFKSISNQDITTNELTIIIPQGKYSIGMRLYNTIVPISFPLILVDAQEKVAVRHLDIIPLLYPKDIFNKKGILYYIIHQYIYLVMSNKVNRNNEYLRKEYLPVGNPETIFKYGIIPKRQSLNINVAQGILSNSLVYLTVYNLCSFPILSEQIFTENFSSEKFNNDSTYLIRIVPFNSQNINDQIVTINTF